MELRNSDFGLRNEDTASSFLMLRVQTDSRKVNNG
jgi:hypothetical protein